jgi:glutamyl-tRNA synthetase
MILRFDDTNPKKEKMEFVDSITEDLKNMKITWSKLTYSSDYFPQCEQYCEYMIKNGLAYCDNTP